MPWAQLEGALGAPLSKQSCFQAVSTLGHQNPGSPTPVVLCVLLPRRLFGGLEAQDVNRGVPTKSRSSQEKVVAVPRSQGTQGNGS